MTEENTFLPIGSLVILKEGAIKKLMIVQRANVAEGRYFDYGAVLYPEGMVDDNLVYFNKEDIFKVIFEAYTDEDNTLMTEKLVQMKEEFLASPPPAPAVSETALFKEEDDDPFASVRDMEID
ncbi:DUF4176 domain-containing protein [Lactovum odontotermitis]